MNRIDWRSYAKTGDLTTVEFREYGASTHVVVVDARAATAVSTTASAPTSRTLALYAASRLVEAVATAGDRPGMVVLGPDECVRWVPPTDTARTAALGLTHAIVVDEHDEWSGATLPFAVDDAEWIADWLVQELDSTGGVTVVSPLLDDRPVELAVRFLAHGVCTTVLSPIPGSPQSPGARLAVAERRARIDRLRAGTATVLDWSSERSLDTLLSDAEVART